MIYDRGSSQPSTRAASAPAIRDVGVEAEPSGGGAGPGDDVDAGIGEQACRVEDRGVIALTVATAARESAGWLGRCFQATLGVDKLRAKPG